MAKLIPAPEIKDHKIRDGAYPTLPEANPGFKTNQENTLPKALRFKDPQCYYQGYSAHLSAVDFNSLYKSPNNIRKFDRQFIRDDIFLSKQQVAVIEAKKAQSKEKAIRMEKLKEEQEIKDKNIEKQMGLVPGSHTQNNNTDLLEKG